MINPDLLKGVPMDVARQICEQHGAVVTALNDLIAAVQAQYPFQSQHVQVKIQAALRALGKEQA